MIARFFGMALAALVAATSARAQIQVQKLVAFDAEAGDDCGRSVDLDGTWAAVGCPLNDDQGLQAGGVYVYQRVNGLWTLAQKLVASDGSDSASFGSEVDIDGARMLITAPLATPASHFAAGAAYVFELVGGVWTEQAKVWASDAHTNQQLGFAAHLAGDVLVLGEQNDSTVGSFAGAAYVFERVG